MVDDRSIVDMRKHPWLARDLRIDIAFEVQHMLCRCKGLIAALKIYHAVKGLLAGHIIHAALASLCISM